MADMYKVSMRAAVYPPSEDSFAITDAVIQDCMNGNEQLEQVFKSSNREGGCAKQSMCVLVCLHQSYT